VTFTQPFLTEARAVLDGLPAENIERLACSLADVRDAGGRLFVPGLGDSGANASHLVNDFRNTAGMGSYAPAGDVSEFTVRKEGQ